MTQIPTSAALSTGAVPLASLAPLATPALLASPVRRRRWRGRLVAVVALAGGVGVAAYGIIGRERSHAALQTWTDQEAVPTVSVIRASAGPATRTLRLPGTIQADFQAPIYARVGGYVKTWYKDIGARVKTGDVLAEIETPDLDQQLMQARAELVRLQATAKLAALTAARWKALLASNSVSQQTSDEKNGDAEASRAAVEGGAANVQRLLALEGFKRITSPLDGIVTARNIDIGALTTAGSSAGPALFSVADTRRMRVYVRVPQSDSGQLQPGLSATFDLAQYPGREFQARLETTSGAIAEQSRTVLAELIADNHDGVLWPGTFAEVDFAIPQRSGLLQLPTGALLFRKEGMQVAVLDDADRVALRSVRLGRNFGETVEVLDGITASDRVINHPADGLQAGESVHVEAAAATTEGEGALKAPQAPPGPAAGSEH
jgi:RND family efflux transporter MFP subunit